MNQQILSYLMKKLKQLNIYVLSYIKRKRRQYASHKQTTKHMLRQRDVQTGKIQQDRYQYH